MKQIILSRAQPIKNPSRRNTTRVSLVGFNILLNNHHSFKSIFISTLYMLELVWWLLLVSKGSLLIRTSLFAR
ncbi:hypothetical protein RDI58_001064 [Solanum bulbocastanum]|uniref:Uncharacterized protein n=1 Tax=Solanum bulbocastanum TaxID=147425 RepID=A0AAN8YPM5_SOLBU